MRSKSLFSAAIALSACLSLAPSARAAGAKGKAAAPGDKADKKKAAELHADEKAMKKQFNWEDKILGPDDKRAELDKIARAHAINEKAEKDKERQAALEPPPAPKAAPSANKKSEVALPVSAEEKSLNADKGSREISPKLSTEAAQAPVAPTKPADDKFIDKLLKEEHASSRKKTNASDRELENLLAGAKNEKHKRGDSVDDLLKSADKGPAMPAPRASSALPEWTKTPDVAPAAAAPVAAKAPVKKNDGVIQVVQGAASFSTPPPAPPPVATRTTLPGARKGAPKGATAKQVVWNDPFADKKTFDRKTLASRESFTPAATVNTVSRKESAPRPTTTATSSSSNWNDPFADAPETRKPARRAVTPPARAASAPASAPKRSEKPEPSAHPPGWKDPFTKAPAEPTRAPVAMRELGKNESSKWEIAARHAPVAHAADAHGGGWAVLKKRPR